MPQDVLQETLLNIYNSQLVAHSALTLAASLAYLTFVGIFLRKTKPEWKSSQTIFFIIAGGILLGFMIYFVGRTISYGCLLETAIDFNFEQASKKVPEIWPEWTQLKNELGDYRRAITDLAHEYKYPNLKSLLELFSEKQVCGIISSLFLGGLITFAILAIYKRKARKKKKVQKDDS